MKPSVFAYVFAACVSVTQFSGLNASPLPQSPPNRHALSNIEVRGLNDSSIKDGHESLAVRSESEEGLLLRSDVVDPVLVRRTQTTGASGQSGDQTANPPSGSSGSNSRSNDHSSSTPSTSGPESPHGTTGHNNGRVVDISHLFPPEFRAFHAGLSSAWDRKPEDLIVPGDDGKVRDNNPTGNNKASGSDP